MEDYRTNSYVTKPPMLNRSRLMWEISSVLLNKEMRILISPKFYSDNTDAYEWEARMWTSRETSARNAHLVIYIYNTKSALFSTIQRKYRIPSINGREAYTKTFVSKTCGENYFIDMNDLGGYISSSDTLTITFEVTTYGDPVHTLRPKIEVPECKRVDNLGLLLFESRQFSDVTIVTSKDKKIQAHKAVLAAESTVFSAMFKSDTMEDEKNLFVIIDVESEVLEEMLRFVYTGKTEKLGEMALDLLAAAETYDLRKLKVNCEAAICKNITVENAADVLIQANLYQARKLKMITLDFIVGHLKEVSKTKTYETSVTRNRGLMGEIIKMQHRCS